MRIEAVDYHTGGEPFRIVTGGVEAPRGATILDKRRDALTRLDAVRRLLVFEPRGHADMYGCFVVEPNDEGADLGVVFFHNAGYSTACGHGTIALVTWALDEGIVECREGENHLVVDVPSGRLQTWAQVERGRVRSVRFRNVPAFVWSREVEAGERTVDVAFGGAFYASLEETVAPRELPRLIELGRELKRSLEAEHEIVHPLEPELRDVYGVTFWQEEAADPLTQRNVTVFADGEVDRSPCGSGTSARLALLDRSGRLPRGEQLRHLSIVGSEFRGPGRRRRRRRGHAGRRDRRRRQRLPNRGARLHAGRRGSARRGVPPAVTVTRCFAARHEPFRARRRMLSRPVG